MHAGQRVTDGQFRMERERWEKAEREQRKERERLLKEIADLQVCVNERVTADESEPEHPSSGAYSFGGGHGSDASGEESSGLRSVDEALQRSASTARGAGSGSSVRGASQAAKRKTRIVLVGEGSSDDLVIGPKAADSSTARGATAGKSSGSTACGATSGTFWSWCG